MLESPFPVSLTSLEFRQACGQFATGVAILTTIDLAGVPSGMTINSFVSLSLEPPLVMVAIAHSSNQLSAFESSGTFAVNFLGEAQRDLSTLFARTGDDRFRDLPWEAGATGSPILEGIIGALECRIVERFDAGDHRVFIGEAVEARIAEGKPLLFFHSAYQNLAG